jgi:phosphonate transport system permease protein
MALPLAILAAANVTPLRSLYLCSAVGTGFVSAVPNLVWALLLVTAVGLGHFPGALALSVHSIGCSVACSPRRSSTWTWRRSMR